MTLDQITTLMQRCSLKQAARTMLTTTKVIPASASTWPEFPLSLHLPACGLGIELAKLLSPTFSTEIHKSGHLLYQLLIVTAGKRNKTENIVNFGGF